MMTSIFQRAADLVNRGWVQNHEAIDSERNVVRATNKNAVCFCAEGAIRRALHDVGIRDQSAVYSLWRTAANAVHSKNLAHWNDASHRGKNEVVALLRGCAESVRS